MVKYSSLFLKVSLCCTTATAHSILVVVGIRMYYHISQMFAGPGTSEEEEEKEEDDEDYVNPVDVDEASDEDSGSALDTPVKKPKPKLKKKKKRRRSKDSGADVDDKRKKKKTARSKTSRSRVALAEDNPSVACESIYDNLDLPDIDTEAPSAAQALKHIIMGYKVLNQARDGRFKDLPHLVPFTNIVFNDLNWQRELDDLLWGMVLEGQRENLFTDIPPAGLITVDYTREEMQANLDLIATANFYPYGGQHGIYGIMEHMKESSVARKYWKDKGGFLATVYALKDVFQSDKHMMDKIVQYLVNEHEAVQVFGSGRSWMAKIKALRKYLFTEYADYDAFKAFIKHAAKAEKEAMQLKLRESWRTPNSPTWANMTIRVRIAMLNQATWDLLLILEKMYLNLQTLGQAKLLKKREKQIITQKKRDEKKLSKQTPAQNFLLMSMKARAVNLKKTPLTSKATGSKDRVDLPGSNIERVMRKSTPEVVKSVLQAAINKKVAVKKMHVLKDKLMRVVRLRLLFCIVARVKDLEEAVTYLPKGTVVETLQNKISEAQSTTNDKAIPDDKTITELFEGTPTQHEITKLYGMLPLTLQQLCKRISRNKTLENQDSVSQVQDDGLIKLQDDLPEDIMKNTELLQIELPSCRWDELGVPEEDRKPLQVLILQANACDFDFLSKVWPRMVKFTACKFSAGFGWNMFPNDSSPTPVADLKKMVDNFQTLAGSSQDLKAVMRITCAPERINDAYTAMETFHNVGVQMDHVVWHKISRPLSNKEFGFTKDVELSVQGYHSHDKKMHESMFRWPNTLQGRSSVRPLAHQPNKLLNHRTNKPYNKTEEHIQVY